MGRRPCCDKVGLKRGSWTAEEDKKLINFMLNQQHGHCCWRAVPKLAGLLRCGKSCRLRWTNYLRPDLRRGLLSESEEKLVIDLHAKLGNRWSKIASHLPGRTDNEIKNIWNTHIKKKLRKMGVDPLTHKLELARSADHRQEKDEPAASSDSMHRTRVVDDQEAKDPSPSLIDSDHCPEFRVEEVPIIQPHEMLIPWPESSSCWDCSSSLYSLLSSSSCSSPGSSAKAGRQTHEYPCMEIQESVRFWGLDDDINGWLAFEEEDKNIYM